MNRLEETHTSLDLSKFLKEKGFETELYWCVTDFACRLLHEADERITYKEHIPAYDILNDLCGRYAKELFGEKSVKMVCAPLGIDKYVDNKHIIASNIVRLLQQGNKEEAEQYIKENIITNN